MLKRGDRVMILEPSCVWHEAKGTVVAVQGNGLIEVRVLPPEVKLAATLLVRENHLLPQPKK